MGDELSIDFVNEMLFEYQFKRVDFVTEPGEFSVRGGIIDVFLLAMTNPIALNSLGTRSTAFVLSMWKPSFQLIKRKITVMPNVENKHLDEIRESFLKYISDKTIVFLRNLDLLSAQTDKLFAKAEDAFKELSENVKHSAPKELLQRGTDQEGIAQLYNGRTREPGFP